MAMNKLTIYEIAKKAGVSASTVSRVINNYPYVKKTTRDKVFKALEQMDYVPDENARGLKNQSSKLIGILIPKMGSTQHAEDIFYIEREFSKKGYFCLISNTGGDPEQQVKYIKLLTTRRVDAIILLGSIYQNETIQKAINEQFSDLPIAICNGILDGPNVYSVVSDERASVCEVVKILAEKGHKNFAFVSNTITASSKNKYEGFIDGFQRYVQNGNHSEIKLHNAVYSNNDDIPTELPVAIKKLIDDNPEIDAMIFATDYLAMIGMRALFKLGKKVPDDVAVVGINNTKYSECCNPSLTSIDTKLSDAGLMVVRNILNVLEGEHVPSRMQVCPTIVERETT